MTLLPTYILSSDVSVTFLVRVALLVFKDERLELPVKPSAGDLSGETPKPYQTTLKMENPQVSICPQKICGRKSANLPGFKIYLPV